MTSALADEWRRLMDACEVTCPAASEGAYQRLLAAYSEPHRAYHNLNHIDTMLFYLFEIAWADPFLLTRNIRLATWYHDVIYDPHRVDNEQRSADVAEAALGELGLKPEIIRRVGDLILMTRTHARPDADPEADLFLDLDLSILGANPATYAEYSAAIRREYDWVTDFDFYAGRRKVLQSFQARSRIFSQDWYDRFSEKQARANIAVEIAQIDAQLRTMPS